MQGNGEAGLGSGAGGGARSGCWKILTAAVHPMVHAATRIALSQVTLHGRSLEFRAAFTEAEARRILADESDIALVLTDMVLDDDDSGLRIARAARVELRNPHVRIVLCTADRHHLLKPEVARQLDISDYRERSEVSHATLLKVTQAAIDEYCALSAADCSQR